MTQTADDSATDRRVIAARRIVAHIARHLQADLSLRLWTGEVLPLGPGARDDIQIVIARFIFPGGELDTIGMKVTNLGRLGFETLDVEDMREHFELTLKHWEDRLYARREEAYALVGEARTRLWLIYFALFKKGFERGSVLVYQTVAQKRRPGPSGLPLDRASLYA